MFYVSWKPSLRHWGLLCRSAEQSQMQVKSVEALLKINEVLCNAKYSEKAHPSHLKLGTSISG